MNFVWPMWRSLRQAKLTHYPLFAPMGERLRRFGLAEDERSDQRRSRLLHVGHEANADAILVFSMKPTKVLAFAKGTFGQTRHRFQQE